MMSKIPMRRGGFRFGQVGASILAGKEMRKRFLFRYLVGACLIAATLCAQAPIQPNLENLDYPALAKTARIQGTVKFIVGHQDIQLVSGHLMLVPAARDNLTTWAPSQSLDAELDVSYIFRLGDRISVESVEQKEPIGNPVSRAFRRLFRLPTTRIVTVKKCESAKSIKSFRDVSDRDRPAVEIVIEAGGGCVETQSSYLASSRPWRRSAGDGIGSGVAAPSERGSEAP
jgi:hypothetical protein